LIVIAEVSVGEDVSDSQYVSCRLVGYKEGHGSEEYEERAPYVCCDDPAGSY